MFGPRFLPPGALPAEKKMKRRSFTPEEDAQLVEIITSNPSRSWSEVAESLPGRSARQCRERWSDYLNPDVRVEPWTDDDDERLLRQIEVHGHRWTIIAMAFPRRIANDVKNRWYSHLRYCAVYIAPGRMDFLRDLSGCRIHGRLKRRRKPSLASRAALEMAQQQRTSEGRASLGMRVWLPQLCAPDCARLAIEEVIAK
jgi:hypothetical protein